MNGILPDIPRFYTALAEWGACIVYLMTMNCRLRGWRFFIMSACALAVQAFFLTITQGIGIYFWIPCMTAAVVLMFLFISICGRVSVADAGYYCVRAFVLAELAASLEWQIYCFFWPRGDSTLYASLTILVVAYASVFFCTYLLEKRNTPKEGKLVITSKELFSTIVIGVAVFAFSNLSFVSAQTPFSSRYSSEIFIIRTMVDFGGFAILYAHHVQFYELRVRRELEAVQNILQNQYLQYQQSKESIELINRKYHDLKHQIGVLRAEPDAVKRGVYLDAMEAEIKTYEAQNKTGNPVLDTVLTSKSMYSASRGISLTCVANGKLLDFIDVMDICTVFGNALDNAIECAERITDPEKRLVHVAVFAQKSFLVMRFENYYEGELFFEGGLPATTKGNKAYHGFGLKSIRYVALKYGGTLVVRTEKNWFKLEILIHMPEAYI